MASPRIEAARLDWDAQGTPHSGQFDDIYHSADGGPGQARHVFIAGNQLELRWAGRERFVILENGFGTGLNFLATWATWRGHAQRPHVLHYLAVEKHPFNAADLARLHTRWPEFAELSAQLIGQWPLPLPGFHRLEFASPAGRVVLTLLFGEVQACLEQLQARVDAFYLDGFDPRKNPAMWSETLMRQLAHLAAPDATLATWCVAGEVRTALLAAGFVLDKRPGFGRKREMLIGHWPSQASAEPLRHPQHHALIVGAGLAGCALAQRLCARGWRVELIERHAAPAEEGSGNRAGIVRPLISRDDNLGSRLNRACFLHTQRAWRALDAGGHAVRRGFDGVVQIARDAEQEAQQRELAESWPAEYVRFIEREALTQRLGYAIHFGGLCFDGGGWAQPPSATAALLADCGAALQGHFGHSVATLSRLDGRWQARDEAGELIAEAPVLILASGVHTGQLDLSAELPINKVRGQVSHVPAGKIPHLDLALCSEGYLTPAVDGIHCLGASYAHDEGEELRESETQGNLERLARMLPGAEAALVAAELGGRVGFRATTADRLPLIGALPVPGCEPDPTAKLADIPRLPDCYGLLGLGSRGLVWAMLAAETLASQIEGDPLPLEAELIAATDPARHLLRKKKKRLA